MENHVENPCFLTAPILSQRLHNMLWSGMSARDATGVQVARRVVQVAHKGVQMAQQSTHFLHSKPHNHEKLFLSNQMCTSLVWFVV